MANSITAIFPTVWSAKAQDILFAKVIGRQLCSETLFSSSAKGLGDTIERPYRGANPDVVNYVRNTDIAVQDIAYNSDQLTIDQQKATKITQIDEFDKVQSLINVMEVEVMVHAKSLAQAIDKHIFEVMAADAGTTFGDGNGSNDGSGPWTAGDTDPVTMTGDLFVKMVSKLKSTLVTNNANDGPRFLVVDADTYELAEEKLITLGFNTADAVIGEGFKGRFRGVNIYTSNNLDVDDDTTPTERYIVGGVEGSTDLAMQADVKIYSRENSKNQGTNVWASALYKADTQNNLKVQLVKFVVAA